MVPVDGRVAGGSDRMDDMAPLALATPRGARAAWVARHIDDAARIGFASRIVRFHSDIGKLIADDEVWQMILLRHLREMDGEGGVVVEPCLFERTDGLLAAPDADAHVGLQIPRRAHECRAVVPAVFYLVMLSHLQLQNRH